MRTALIAMTAAVVSGAVVGAPSPVNAGCRGCYSDTGFAAGWNGGEATYAFGPYYNYGPGYYYGPGCYWRRQRVWDWDGQYWVIRRMMFCR
jgi:hypothetical protein